MIVLLTQCFPPDRGGIETFMGQLANALHEAGEAVTVLADPGHTAGPEPAWPFTVRRFAGPRFWRRWRKARAVAALGPRAVIADSWKSLEALPDTAPPTLTFAYGNELLRREGRRGDRMRRAFARASVVVAISRYTAGLMQGLHARVEVVPPPITPPPPATRRRPPGRTILGLGRLEPRKGFDRVIEALPGLPGARFELVGEGADRGRLEALAAALGVADRVQLHGGLNERAKAQALADADLFAMPARRAGDSVEGYGLVYLEAGCFGLPSVAGLAGGAADAVLHGETGLLVDGDDPAAVRTALASLLDDPALRARMGDAARRHALALSWAATLPRLLSLLRSSAARSA